MALLIVLPAISNNYKNVLANNDTITHIISKRKSIRIAKIKIYKTYGYFSISLRQRPYVKEFEGSLLKMRGTIRKGRMGGVFHITIDRTDGKVKSISHGK